MPGTDSHGAPSVRPQRIHARHHQCEGSLSRIVIRIGCAMPRTDADCAVAKEPSEYSIEVPPRSAFCALAVSLARIPVNVCDQVAKIQMATQTALGVCPGMLQA
eukprot:1008250-Rhodomonas_salina.4